MHFLLIVRYQRPEDVDIDVDGEDSVCIWYGVFWIIKIGIEPLNGNAIGVRCGIRVLRLANQFPTDDVHHGITSLVADWNTNNLQCYVLIPLNVRANRIRSFCALLPVYTGPAGRRVVRLPAWRRRMLSIDLGNGKSLIRQFPYIPYAPAFPGKGQRSSFGTVSSVLCLAKQDKSKD